MKKRPANKFCGSLFVFVLSYYLAASGATGASGVAGAVTAASGAADSGVLQHLLQPVIPSAKPTTAMNIDTFFICLILSETMDMKHIIPLDVASS